MTHVDAGPALERARAAHRERRWADAVTLMAGLDDTGALGGEDLERLAEALDLVGRGSDAVAVLQRAYAARAGAGQVGEALRDAFWLWRALAFNAEFARAGAWAARAARLVADRADCPQRGYLLLPEAERRLRDGDHRGAFATAARAGGCGERCGDHDLSTVAAHLQGRALAPASSRCSGWSPRGGATGRSPPSWCSARRRCSAT